MRRTAAFSSVAAVLLAALLADGAAQEPAPQPRRGAAKAESARPKHFPHRIWAACDFEGQTPDYGWFGPKETKNIPRYPGNATALGVGEKPYGNFSALMTGINPVPGPRMGKVNQLYVRYYLKGATEATFQHFSLSSNDNNHIRVSGLDEGRWSELTMNFTRDGQRNDGTPGVPFADGERMDDLKVFVGKPGDGKDYDLAIDDVIFFADDPELPPDPEPFPNRVIFLAAFDTGITPREKPKYWPGELEVASQGLPPGAYWGAARAVPRKDGKGKLVQLKIDPPRPVGAHTKLRFRYHLTGAKAMTVQIFDLTDMDNRHIHVRDPKTGAWTFTHLDFTRDARRNDGGDTPFAAGHRVDDIFFFVDPEAGGDVDLLLDEVVLYDAGGAAAPAAAKTAAEASWVESMREVHGRFKGERGTFAHFGDSITISMAFWASLRGARKNASPEMEAAFKDVDAYMKPDCWSGWKGPEYGNNGSMTIRWADENADKWLKRLNPEAALIMFGTNDLSSVPIEEYEERTRAVVKKCLDNGTVVILTTIPPRSGMLEESRRFAAAAAKVARELRVPLCDYFGACLDRRPDDWDGAAEKFKGYEVYEAPTVISRDGVHPSNPKRYQGDYSEEGLRSNGFVLRNYVTLMAYHEVIRSVLGSAAGDRGR
jgi:lysophospholipase L1-like esterase